ncbi:Uncharacterised protein [Mycobacteroides abscessus subsp. abscessus]|nr:Uncharacterised protein [Mycobacteroides abscessus subsp. abscessus]
MVIQPIPARLGKLALISVGKAKEKPMNEPKVPM